MYGSGHRELLHESDDRGAVLQVREVLLRERAEQPVRGDAEDVARLDQEALIARQAMAGLEARPDVELVRAVRRAPLGERGAVQRVRQSQRADRQRRPGALLVGRPGRRRRQSVSRVLQDLLTRSTESVKASATVLSSTALADSATSGCI